MRYHGDRWVTDDFCCHRHRHQKKRCFCAVSALFPNRLSPSRKSKLLIASMLSTDGDSDRCFETFFYIKAIQLPLVQIDCGSERALNYCLPASSTCEILNKVIKRRFPNHKTAFFTSENGVLQSENGVFLTIKCKGKRVFSHHLYSYTFALCFFLQPATVGSGRTTTSETQSIWT